MVVISYSNMFVSRKYRRLMNGVNVFIVKPLGEEYNYKQNDVLISSSIEDASFTNRIGIVISTPIGYKGNINVNDLVIVGHNIFRTYYNMKGRKTKSTNYFKDGMYILGVDEIFLYKKQFIDYWESEGDYCAVKPIPNHSRWSNERHRDVAGMVTVLNKDLKKQGVSIGDTVVFKDGSEYEFKINDDKWYLMRSINIFAIE